MVATADLSRSVGTLSACMGLSVSRATYYRWMTRPALSLQEKAKPRSFRALKPNERQDVIDALRSGRFVDASPAEVYATLLDEAVSGWSRSVGRAPGSLYRVARCAARFVARTARSVARTAVRATRAAGRAVWKQMRAAGRTAAGLARGAWRGMRAAGRGVWSGMKAAGRGVARTAAWTGRGIANAAVYAGKQIYKYRHEILTGLAIVAGIAGTVMTLGVGSPALLALLGAGIPHIGALWAVTAIGFGAANTTMSLLEWNLTDRPKHTGGEIATYGITKYTVDIASGLPVAGTVMSVGSLLLPD